MTLEPFIGPLAEENLRLGRGESSVEIVDPVEVDQLLIQISLEKEQGQWVVQGVNYNSPVLIPLLECPHCGVTQKSITKFCADCGKPMRPSTEADDPTEQTEAE